MLLHDHRLTICAIVTSFATRPRFMYAEKLSALASCTATLYAAASAVLTSCTFLLTLWPVSNIRIRPRHSTPDSTRNSTMACPRKRAGPGRRMPPDGMV